MTKTRYFSILPAVWLAMAVAVALPVAADGDEAAAFEQLCARIQQQPRQVAEADVLAALATGTRLGRPYAAFLAARSYLARQERPSAELVKHAVENALAAGEVLTAVNRCKAFLQHAEPSAASSEIAGMLFAIQVNLLNDGADAYRTMQSLGDRFRQHALARRFDGWYLSRARTQRDYTAVANRLDLIFSERLPVDVERTLFHGTLDWLLEELRWPANNAQKHEAAGAMRRLAGRIREDRALQAEAAFVAANLAFDAARTGKDSATLDQDYQAVATSAGTFFAAAPTAATLIRILDVFADGDPNRGYAIAAAPKRAFFADHFAKLDDAGRETVLAHRFANRNLNSVIATPRQWAELGQRLPAFFKAGAAYEVPFLTDPDDPAWYGRQAAFLQGIDTRDAALINTLAQPGVLAGLEHLLLKESWRMTASETMELIHRQILPAWRDRKDADGTTLDNAALQRIAGAFLVRHLPRTPLAVQREAARDYLEAAWGSLADKGDIVAHLDALSWVPYQEADREFVLSGVHRTFSEWVGQQRSAAGDDAEAGQRLQAQISRIEEAFTAARRRSQPALDQAPDALCRALAACLSAIHDNNAAAYAAAAVQLRDVLADMETARPPLAMEALRLLANPPDNMATIEVQLDLLKTLLARWDPARRNTAARAAAGRIVRSGHRWNWRAIPREDAEKSKQISRVIAEALLAQIDAGRFSAELFDWMLNTQVGQHWSDHGMNRDVLARMVETDILRDDAYRPGGTRMAATAYMWLARHQFGSPDTLDLRSAFDALVLAEAEATGRLDDAYWQLGGQDGSRALRDFAARRMLAQNGVPRDFGPDSLTDSRSIFFSWERRVLTGASAEPRDALLKHVMEQFGRTRHDSHARGYTFFEAQASVGDAAGRALYFQHIALDNTRRAALPIQLPPVNLGHLRSLRSHDLTDAELDVLHALLAPAAYPRGWERGRGHEQLALTLHDELLRRGRKADLVPLLAHFWAMMRDSGDVNLQNELRARVQRLQNAGDDDLAVAYATAALQVMRPSRADEFGAAMSAIQARSIVRIGGLIPVPRSDRRYPAFEAQADFIGGNYDRAWRQYQQHAALVQDVFAELDMAFVTWIISRLTEVEEYASAERLAQGVIQWMDSAGVQVAADVRLEVLLAYANLQLSRESYPAARALYEQIAAAEVFRNLRGAADARIMIAEVARLTGELDAAVERLEELVRSEEPYTRKEALYYLAKVRFDQEDYQAAHELLRQVFMIDDTHADARILEGRVNLSMNRLENVIELEKIGLSAQQQVIVPGRPLRINLEDHSLAVVGDTAAVQIRVWSDAGDEELITLLPFADSLIRFRGEIVTALAPVQPGDGVLQVLGGGEVYYDFAPDFREQHRVPDFDPPVLQVKSAASLQASSGRILTEEELAEQDLMRQIEARLRRQQRLADDASVASPLSMRRPGTQLKPGQNLNIRVTDPDRSVSPERNTVTVRIRTTSGDSIEAFELLETDTHSGIFEGTVPSAPAPATAFASDSDEGSEANYVISAGDHPAWVGLRDNQRPKLFSIDLNDSIFPDVMTIEAGIQGRRLREFLVQTAGASGGFTTVGSWPRAYPVWDGAPRATVIAVPEAVDARVRAAWGTDFLNQLIENAPIADRHVVPRETVSAAWDRNVFGKASALRIHHDTRRADAWYLVRLDAAFYLPERQVRTFELVPDTKSGEATYRMAVNGTHIAGERLPGNRTAPPRFHGALQRGMHTISIYVIAGGHAEPRFTVRQDSPEPPYMVDVAPALFDPATFPPASDLAGMQPARVTANEEGSQFTVSFEDPQRTRVVRLLIHDFETDAPAIERIHLTDIDGTRVLPVEYDLMELRQNNQIEVIPGDTIAVSYEDPSYLSERDRVQEAFLTASYHNAEISAHMVVGYTEDRDGMRQPVHARLLRYKPGDSIDIIVEDPDEDVSEARDTVALTVQTTFGEPQTFQAQETAPHSGVFQYRLFPVSRPPEREGEIQVEDADELVISYLDRENTDPGVPYPRSIALEQVWYQEPELGVYSVSSAPLSEAVLERNRQRAQAEGADRAMERVPPRRSLTVHAPDVDATADTVPSIIIGGPFVVDLVWPTIAQSSASTAAIYVQTASGRAAAGFVPTPERPFDITVPGTLRLDAGFSPPSLGPVPAGYDRFNLVPLQPTEAAEEAGRFIVNIPNTLGAVPDRSFSEPRAAGIQRLLSEEDERRLHVNGRDTVHIGFAYTNDVGVGVWLTQDVALAADAFLDVMDRNYHESLQGRFVGEVAYLRVIDALADVSAERDTVTVQVETGPETETALVLTESMSHSGVFKGVMRLVHTEESDARMPGDIAVQFGDRIRIRYATEEPRPVALVAELAIHKGDDGIVLPFTKAFDDGEIAVRTQLSIAEAHFELAKRHRQLGQEALTREAISQGREILEEAMRDFPDTRVRVQGDYLLADLALELAEELAPDSAERAQRLQEALSRFSAIVAMYPDSTYAPRAQYKKALTLEAMGNFDLASEEYVKLSYRWPENELIAETIARLGQYFFRRGREMNEQADAHADAVEAERLRLQAREMFTTAAQVFSRLAPRFPSHQLANQASVLSGQCYIRAERFGEAAAMLLTVINNDNAGVELRSESMYWCADAYLKDGDLTSAYRMFKRLTWDYPETNWARFARGQLATDRFARMED